MKPITRGLSDSPDPKSVGELEIKWESKIHVGACDVEGCPHIYVKDMQVGPSAETWPVYTNLTLCVDEHEANAFEIYEGGNHD
jgi:hypothetical protein